MNKKGAGLIVFILEIVLVVSLISVSSFAAVKLSSDETLVQMNLANDIKMMVDVFIALPGDAVVEIPYNTEKYVVTLRQKGVEVRIGEELSIKKSYSLPLEFRAAKKLENVKTICLVKKENIITMKECGKDERRTS